MELDTFHQEKFSELEEEMEEDQNAKYFSIWDLWIGVGSRVLDDFAAALWFVFLLCVTLKEVVVQNFI